MQMKSNSNHSNRGGQPRLSPTMQKLQALGIVVVIVVCVSSYASTCSQSSLVGLDFELASIQDLYPKKAAITVPKKGCPSLAGEDLQLMSMHEIHKVIMEYYTKKFNVALPCSFVEIGKLLYQHAVETNQALLTVQVGGMDGKSNDPMYKMFVKENASTLKNWIPVVVEPVPDNFKSLTTNYANVQSVRDLECPLLSNWAISYDNAEEGCTFCRFDTSDTSEQVCKDHPDWMKYQIGTLDCAYSKRFFNKNFETCVIQDKVNCGSVNSLLGNEYGFPDQPPIAMVQIDVEGYEKILIPGMLGEFISSSLPPIIHFEHKVLREKDKKKGWKFAVELNEVLRNRGYELYDQGEDMLAIRVR